ncbi:MAG: RAD55 family ATPase [Thermoplasmatota archaeon]
MPLTTTGISGLDAQLGGGFPRGTTVLLLAEPGNAPGAFAEQFGGGGLDVGDALFVFELDRPVTGMHARIRAFSHAPAGKRVPVKIFDSYSTQFGKGEIEKGDEGTVFPTLRKDMYARVLNELSQIPHPQPFRLVIESLSPLVTPETRDATIEFVRQVSYLTAHQNGVTLVSLVKGLHDPVFETSLKHLVGGNMEIGTERKGFGLYSYLLISKMVGVPDPLRLLLFKETDKGLWLESTKRVF